MAFQENLNASICMFSFFRSHGSNVSHGSGCRAGFFHGYAWCSLRLCSCGLTTRMESLKMFPHHQHHHHHLVFFSVLRFQFVLIGIKKQLVQNRYAADKNGTQYIRRRYVTCTLHYHTPYIRHTYVAHTH